MPKIKTHKATFKRIKKTKTGKLLHRKSGQDHFNSRESTKKTLNKRSNRTISRYNKKSIKKLIPYYKRKKYAR